MANQGASFIGKPFSNLNVKVGTQQNLVLISMGKNGLLGKKTRETGLEPATSAVTGQRSNQLNYSRVGVLGATGLEPMTTCV